MSKTYTYVIASFLLIIFVTLAITSIYPNRKSATCDELAHHIPVGYVLLTKWDFKMDTSHPPLSRYIVALPLKLFMKLNMPNNKMLWRRADRSDFGKDFFYKYNTQPHKVLFLSRLAVVIVGIICGIILFIWAKILYGEKSALFALLLYSFSPNILAHAGLATTDMVTACFVLLAVLSFWLFVKNPAFKNVIFAGICIGLAQLSKYSSVLLYPLFLLLSAFELVGAQKADRRDIIFKLFAIFAISIIVLWVGYGFDSSPILKNVMRIEEKIEIAHNIAKKISPFWDQRLSDRLDYFLLNTPFPLGAHILGILGVLRHSYEGHGIYFLGKWSSYGNPLYFMVAFLIKTPIPTIIFLITGLFISLREGIKTNERFILITIILFFVTASFTKLQLGLRYILPIYPFCFILAGRSAKLLSNKVIKIPVIILLTWYISSSLWIWPDYLSYFNEFIGGPKNGYKYLRDSNIDWGQDLPALARYLKQNNIGSVKLFYFGTADPTHYGIRYEKLNAQDYSTHQSDVYAISVNYLDGVNWTKDYKPIATIGYSIFVYDFRKG